jgi:hypothetical protein
MPAADDRACCCRFDLKVDDALAVRMPDVRGLGLAILKGRTADGALPLRMLLARAANQPSVANASVAAQMRNDGEIIYDADPLAHFVTQRSLFKFPVS